MLKKIIVGLVILAILAGGFIGFRVWMAGRSQATGDAALYDRVATERRDFSEKVDATGSVVLGENGDIYPAYAATVRQINCQVGQKVKKGDLLLTLDSSAIRTEWANAESTLGKAELNLVYAEKDLEKVNTLYKVQGATVDEVDTARKQVEIYQQELKLARFNQDQLRRNPDDVNFIASDHSGLAIRAPYNGEVTLISVKQGQKVTTDTILLNLVAGRSVEIEAKVDESSLNQIKVGQPADIILNDADETTIKGKVTSIGKTGTTDSGVVVFPVTIQADRPSAQLKRGMSADITIYISTNQDVLAIPQKALLDRRGKQMVRVWKGNKTELVRVKTGLKSGSYVEVVSGLEEGDQLAVEKTKPEVKKTGSTGRNNSMRMGPLGR